MIDRAVALAAVSLYDFRDHPMPDDPLADRWPVWVDAYRLKHALAAILQPVCVAEVGVRYGYSARAFLDGGAGRYIGWDDDDERWGGGPPHVDWAADHLAAEYGDRATVIRQDVTVAGFSFPPDADLVHLDGPQDAASWWRLLDAACDHRRLVLCDGYLYGPTNFAAVNVWLAEHAGLVDWWQVAPWPYGDLLLQTKGPR